MQTAANAFGAIDIRINAADLGDFGPFERMSLDSGTDCRVNLIGAMHSTHATLPQMPGRAGRRGSIIAKGSIGIPFRARPGPDLRGLSRLTSVAAHAGDRRHMSAQHPGKPAPLLLWRPVAQREPGQDGWMVWRAEALQRFGILHHLQHLEEARGADARRPHGLSRASSPTADSPRRLPPLSWPGRGSRV
jgi:NAD(P)-dependent dehydrogenase (short-subunit alcohol dehydrogenase family)